MTLYTFYQENDKVVYGTVVNCESVFFFKGFASEEEAKNAILAPFKGVERMWHETSLIGEWSEIQ